MYNYDDLDDEYSLESAPKKVNTKLLLIFAIFVVLLIIVLSISSNSGYSGIEKDMLNKASQYVKTYGINTSKEIYIDASKLNYNLPSNCNRLSGVIYDGKEYKPYLLCNDYESKIIDVKSNSFQLVGNDVIILLKGMNYYELGIQGKRDYHIGGSVKDEEGVYNLFYISQSDNQVQNRKVIVVNNSNLSNYFPKFINVSNDVKVIKGNNYNDSQINAVDVLDGNITSKIIKVSNINTGLIGEYKNIYYVRNNLGYGTMLQVNVSVVDTDYNEDAKMLFKLSNDNMTNEDVTISITVIGSNYKYTILPDGREVVDKQFEYVVSENGKYNFIIVGDDDRRINRTINITNIDKNKPVAICEATRYNDKTKFKVDVQSFNYIVGYNYIIDNNESGYINSREYTGGKSTSKNIKVKVKDYIGNESIIDCTVSDKLSNLDDNGIRKIVSGKVRLRIPIADALAKRGYTVNDLNQCIYKKVVDAGPGTRYGVVAAAYGLIDCTYNMTGFVLSYNHTSGKVHVDPDTNYCTYNSDICGKLGVNKRWGYSGGQCGSSECWHGLNCATFVRWSMCNGGMNLCTGGSAGAFGMTSKDYFPEADGVYIYGKKVTYYSGRNLTNYSAEQLVRMIKPGDIIAHKRPLDDAGGKSQHTYVVIGRDNDGIYTADDGIFTSKIPYSKMVDGEYSYRILFLDNYYANPNNRNSLYGN